MLSGYYEKRNIELFKELVPAEGFAESVAGELVRAVNRICYRYYNDGDIIGVDYGNETCNPAARYIMQEFKGTNMANVVDSLWGYENYDIYGHGLELLVRHMVDYIDGHPELKSEENVWDMLEFTEPSDKDYEEEEEESMFVEPWAVYDPD